MEKLSLALTLNANVWIDLNIIQLPSKSDGFFLSPLKLA